MCARASAAASGFSITGLLDSQSKTRGRYPVTEISVEDIRDHPNNAIYSMDESEIAKLARSIEKDGLTDLPLVRKLADGSWQMLSGHRRKAAFKLLSETDPRFEKMPCRVVDSVSDAQALTLLHTANLFTRQLSATERAAASRALDAEVEQMRATTPELTGRRTEDIKAAIISEQTGRKVSGKTVRRQEALADMIGALTPHWKQSAEKRELSAEAVERLSRMSASEQNELFERAGKSGTTKRELSVLIATATVDSDMADKDLLRADRALKAYIARCPGELSPQDHTVVDSVAKSLARLQEVS